MREPEFFNIRRSVVPSVKSNGGLKRNKLGRNTVVRRMRSTKQTRYSDFR